MKKIKKIPVTREGFEKLKKNLVELKRIRPEAVNTLSDARKMGDLSENGLYTAAKMRLRSIDSQIFRIETQLKLAEIIEPQTTGTIGLGSKVLVTVGSKTREFCLVGDFEVNSIEGKISSKSPLGKSLIGKKLGEKIKIKTPSGESVIEILKII